MSNKVKAGLLVLVLSALLVLALFGLYLVLTVLLTMPTAEEKAPCEYLTPIPSVMVVTVLPNGHYELRYVGFDRVVRSVDAGPHVRILADLRPDEEMRAEIRKNQYGYFCEAEIHIRDGSAFKSSQYLTGKPLGIQARTVLATNAPKDPTGTW